MTKSNNKRILVADDEPDITLMLKRVLEENGFKVDPFNEPSAVLQSFKPGIYDLLILDIKMPSINGFELYLKLREIDPKVKVCFLTALSELRDYEDYRKEVFPKWGERYFVSKPIENEELIRRVNAMIWSY
ncbi:MAG: response regulator [Thermoproteota archaeon]|nr:response regulator [Thermoproteota archaeon]